MESNKEQLDVLCEKIIGACIRVHQELGPGLLEQAYKEALKIEFHRMALAFLAEQDLHLYYFGTELNVVYRYDFLIENTVVLEVKSKEELAPIDIAQTINYVTIAKKPTALLVNFNVMKLSDGVRRLFPKRIPVTGL